MKVSEINQLTLNEIQQLTPRDLELEVSEILKRYEDSKLPLTPNMLNKLHELARLLPEGDQSKVSSVKTISDYIGLCCNIITLLEKIGAYDKIRDGFKLIYQSFSDLIE